MKASLAPSPVRLQPPSCRNTARHGSRVVLCPSYVGTPICWITRWQPKKISETRCRFFSLSRQSHRAAFKKTSMSYNSDQVHLLLFVLVLSQGLTMMWANYSVSSVRRDMFLVIMLIINIINPMGVGVAWSIEFDKEKHNEAIDRNAFRNKVAYRKLVTFEQDPQNVSQNICHWSGTDDWGGTIHVIIIALVQGSA